MNIPSVFFYGENNDWSIRFDYVMRTYVGEIRGSSEGYPSFVTIEEAVGTLDVVMRDGGKSRLQGNEVPRFMKEYKAYLININRQTFLQEMVKK